MAPYGFDRCMYGRSHFTAGMNIGDESDYMILSNHDHDYFDLFIRSGVFKRSPFFLWSFENVGFESWGNVASLGLSKRALEAAVEVLEVNARFDVTSGYSASFQNLLPGQKSVASICAARGISQEEVDKIWSDNRLEIETVWLAFDIKAQSLPFPCCRNRLSPKQKEVLSWVALGKTGPEIATIMGVSCSSVEKHLRSARDALGAITTAQAVAKLSFLNQLYLGQDTEQRVRSSYL